MALFRRFWAKEPRRSENILVKKCYTPIVVRVLFSNAVPFGDKPVKFQVVSASNGTAVLKGLIYDDSSRVILLCPICTSINGQVMKRNRHTIPRIFQGCPWVRSNLTGRVGSGRVRVTWPYL